MERSRRFWIAGLLAIPLLLYATVVIGPLLYSFFYSFTDWNGLSPHVHFVGLANFRDLLHDPLFYNALRHTAVWIAAALLLPTCLGLALALVLHERVRGASIYKSLFYLPICLSLAVVGQVWIWIYQPDWGLLNVVLRGLGLFHLERAWLADPHTALPAVIVAWAWQQVGLAMVIYLAGLTAVPSELTEASQIDGATHLQALRYVIVPLLRPATLVVVALAVINALKSFDIVYIMTGGGPFHSSDTLAVYMYSEAFQKYLMGYGSAISVVLFLVALVVIGLYFRQVRQLERIYG